MKESFWVFCMDWLAANTPLVISLLNALVPVLALCLALYVIHAMRSKDKGRRRD